jgi:hypothetical protein
MPPNGLTTKIAGRDVPLAPGDLVTAVFTGVDAGTWEFWVAVYPVPEGMMERTGRVRQNVDPGKRFRDLETSPDPNERNLWPEVSNTVRVQPATMEQWEGWLVTHPVEAAPLVSFAVTPYQPK